MLSAVHHPAMFKDTQSWVCCLPIATPGLPGTHLIHQNRLSTFTPTATDPVLCTQPLTFDMVAKSHFLPPFPLHYNNNNDDLVCQLTHHQLSPSSFAFPLAFGFRTFSHKRNSVSLPHARTSMTWRFGIRYRLGHTHTHRALWTIAFRLPYQLRYKLLRYSKCAICQVSSCSLPYFLFPRYCDLTCLIWTRAC